MKFLPLLLIGLFLTGLTTDLSAQRNKLRITGVKAIKLKSSDPIDINLSALNITKDGTIRPAKGYAITHRNGLGFLIWNTEMSLNDVIRKPGNHLNEKEHKGITFGCSGCDDCKPQTTRGAGEDIGTCAGDCGESGGCVMYVRIPDEQVFQYQTPDSWREMPDRGM